MTLNVQATGRNGIMFKSYKLNKGFVTFDPSKPQLSIVVIIAIPKMDLNVYAY